MTAENSLDIGFASIDITPSKPSLMAGFGIRKEPFEGVHDPLHAHFLRAHSGGQAVALVVVEVIGLPVAEIRQLRQRLAPVLEVQPESLMITATHTHGGPRINKAYSAYLGARLEEGARNAVAASEPSWLNCGRTLHRERLGYNRRKLDRGGVPVDPEVPVLAFGPMGGPCRAVFFQYACHPACLDAGNFLITADWPGFACRHLKALHPDHPETVFMLGTAGNINTGYSAGLSALREPIATRNFVEAERLGLALAHTIDNACNSLPRSASGCVASASRTLSAKAYPAADATGIELWCNELKKLDESWSARKHLPQAIIDADKIEIAYADFALERARETGDQRPEPLEAQVLRVGDAFIGGFPGEFFAESGSAFKQRLSSFAGAVFAGGPTNGYEGYIPPRDAFNEGGYEANCCHYAPGTAEDFVDELVMAANEAAGL